MIEIYREIADGLDAVDGYSHLFVLIYFACSRPKQIGALGKAIGSLSEVWTSSTDAGSRSQRLSAAASNR